MLLLRLHVPRVDSARVLGLLDEVDGVRHVVADDHRDGPGTQLTADLDAGAVDAVLSVLRDGGVELGHAAIVRLSAITPTATAAALTAEDDRIIWADLIGQARASSWLRLRYLTFMICAGIIAAFGVIDANTILVVGAMALSPDLLPITAACVGIISGRRHLAVRSLATLVAGLSVAVVVSYLLTLGLFLTGWLPPGWDPESEGLGVLITIDLSSAIVAIVAGVAAMLSFETRASAAVGVAISVTTIPAAAFAGVAAAAGKLDQAWQAVAVLVLNVTLIFVAGVATLAIQRWILERREPGRARPTLTQGADDV